MNKKERSTDLWVYDLLKEANIDIDPQGSTIKEINNALKLLQKEALVMWVIQNTQVQVRNFDCN